MNNLQAELKVREGTSPGTLRYPTEQQAFVKFKYDEDSNEEKNIFLILACVLREQNNSISG